MVLAILCVDSISARLDLLTLLCSKNQTNIFFVYLPAPFLWLSKHNDFVLGSTE